MAKLFPDRVILGLLHAEPCHGYRLLDHFRDVNRLAPIWNLNTGQLYAILKRLERDELLDGREEAVEDAPGRTVYWLTDAGRDTFFEWLNLTTPSASTRHIRTEFLSRLYLSRLLDLPVKHIIDAQKAACHAHKDELITRRDSLKTGVGALSYQLRIDEMTVILEWLENHCQAVFDRV
jgi:DNA-binding PadR family transcriptional regulator